MTLQESIALIESGSKFPSVLHTAEQVDEAAIIVCEAAKRSTDLQLRIDNGDLAAVVHGKWTMDGKEHCHCSSCLFGRNIATQIGWECCPSCGTKMDMK